MNHDDLIARLNDFNADITIEAADAIAALVAERDAAVASIAAPALSPSEAVYGFAGWLTCRDEAVTLGATHDAAPVAELADAYCRSQKLEPPRHEWAKALRPYPSAPQPLTLSDDRIVELLGDIADDNLMAHHRYEVVAAGRAVLAAAKAAPTQTGA